MGALSCNAVLIGFLGIVSSRRIFDPLMSIPPNRYVTPTSLQMLVANVAFFHSSLDWLLLLVWAGLAIVVWKGRLDDWNKPLLIVLIVLCSIHLACILYAESIPFWVERTHGAKIRARIFGRF